MKLSTRIKCFVVGVEMDIKEYKKKKMAKKIGLVPCPIYVEIDDDENEDH